MSFKDIAVYLDPGQQNDARLATSIGLASRHESRLIGIDVSSEAAFTGAYCERALSLEDEFVGRARAAGLKCVYQAADTRSSAVDLVAAHCADLLIATQPHPYQYNLAKTAVPKDVLMATGVPMLVLPNNWNAEKPLGQRVVVAWNFSREATRAMHDAMPVLTAAERVFVFAYAPNYDPRDEGLMEVVAHLRRHGVNAQLDGWRDDGSPDVDPMSALFALLDREGADLIVAGAFGHAPLFEDVFGGASRTLLNNDCMPVLLSH